MDIRVRPRGPTALSHRLTEVIPNLADIGIVVDRAWDKHAKSYEITIKKQDNPQPKKEGELS